MNRRQFLGTTSRRPGVWIASIRRPRSSRRRASWLHPESLPLVCLILLSQAFSGSMLYKFSLMGIERLRLLPPALPAHALSSPGAGGGSGEGARLEEKVRRPRHPGDGVKLPQERALPQRSQRPGKQEEFRQTLQLAEMLDIPTVAGFSGCPGGSPSDTVPIGWSMTGRISRRGPQMAVVGTRHPVLGGDSQVCPPAGRSPDCA